MAGTPTDVTRWTPRPRMAAQAFRRGLDAATPRVLYGVRMTASVALAMWVGFWLQLQHAYWAPLTAAIVCQPGIGASLQKGRYRIIGTCIGAVAIVLLTGAMPQSRIGLVAGLAAWGGLCAIMSTFLKNNAAYAAALAGYTATIVFSDAISATPNQVFIVATVRATEISIGVISAGLVLAATDLGDASHRLAEEMAAIAADIAAGIADTLGGRLTIAQAQERRRALLQRVTMLDPLIDEVRGESASVRYRSRTMEAAVGGLLGALAGWRGMATHMNATLDQQAKAEVSIALAAFEALLGHAWRGDPVAVRQACHDHARHLLELPGSTAGARLLVDRAVAALLGLASGANGLVVIEAPTHALAERAGRRLFIPDTLPALLNGLRVVATIVVASVIWIEVAWPGGQGVVVFAAVVTILFAPQAERAYGTVREFAAGVFIATVLAAVIKFGVLPQQQTFLALMLVIGVVMVPAAALAAGSWHKPVFTGISFIFMALLAPENAITFDIAGYLNSALTIIVGICLAACAYRLVPPLSATWRVRRLLALTLRDLRALAAGRRRRTQANWLGLMTARLGSMPDASPGDLGCALAGLTAGQTIIWLRGEADGLEGKDILASALGDLAAGRVADARHGLARYAASQPDRADGLRAQAETALLGGILEQYAAFFGQARREAA